MRTKQGIKTGLILGLALLLFGSCKEEELYTINEFTKLSCNFNDEEIPNGQSLTAYSAESLVYDAKCSSVAETRTCNDGELSGSFEFASCVEEPPANCSFDNQIVLHEDYVEAFQLSAVEWNQSCNDYKKIRTCDNGTLSEADYIFPSCTATEPLDCTFDSQTILHGADVEAYQLSSVPCLGMRPVVLIEKPAVVRMEFFLGKVSLFLHVSKLPRITVVLMTNWLSTKVV